VSALVSGRTRRVVVVIVAAIVVAGVAVLWGTRTDAMDWSSAHRHPHAEGHLDPGFHAPGVHDFYSSQVVQPDPETWTKVRPSGDYRVLVLAAGKDRSTPQDPQVAILVAAVQKWAKAEDRVKLKVRYLSDPRSFIQELDDAARKDHADLIVTAGNRLVDPVAAVSANYAGENPQQFLVLGAEVAEPTVNIAATDWTGSAYLGEGLQESLSYDPAAVTAPRAYAALRAGVAAVLSGYRSVIVRIPADRY
jgi:hypothetical protein